MGSEQRRKREKEEIREAILQAAMKLFIENGVQKTTIRKIAELIEYTPGAIYSYFKNKDEIYIELHRRGFEKLFSYMLQVFEVPDLRERFIRLGEVYIRFALENPELYTLMFIADCVKEVILESDQWDEGNKTYTVLQNMVRDCMNAGVLPEGDVDTVSLAFWSLVHGTASLVIKNRLTLRPEGNLDEMVFNVPRYIVENLGA